jgi:tetratricopeptide (TPR) repeat protein
MPEPVRCTACRRPYNRQFVKCPFCNAPNPETGPGATAAAPSSRASPTPEGAGRPDFAALAEHAVAMTRPFVPLEFHPAAVVALDHFFDQTWGLEGAAPDQETWQPPDAKRAAIVHFGAFFGELLRREIGGRWQPDPEQPANISLSRVVLKGGVQVFPLSRVFKRLKDGAAQSLGPLYRQAREAAGAAGSGAEVDGWRRYARHFESLGRPDLALSFYDRALALPLNPAVRVELQRQREEAARAAAQAAQATAQTEDAGPPASRPPAAPAAARPAPAAPRPTISSALADAVRNHGSRAATLTAQGRHAEALAELERLLELSPSSVEGLMGRAGALIALGREREALAGLDEIAARSDCEPMRSFQVAVAADRLGDTVKAERAFRSIKDSPTLTPEQRSHSAERAAALARDPAVLLDAIEGLPDVPAMLDAYTRLSEERPELAAPLSEKGVGLAMLGRVEEALACFDRAAGLEPNEPTSCDHKAVTLLRLKRVDEALQALDEGLRRCPTAGVLHCRRGICLAAAGRNDEAHAAFERSLEVDPAYAEAWAYKGDLEARGGKLPAAIASCERFLAQRAGRPDKLVASVRRQLWGLRNPSRSLDEARGQACLDAGLAASLAGRLDEARARFDEGVSADPLSGELWFNRGVTLLQLSRRAEALSSFQRAEELLGPTATVIRGQVVCLLGLGRSDDALRCHDREIERGPANPDALRAKARTLVQAGRSADALPLYQRLVARAPANPALVAERAEALAAAGRTLEARFAYDAALALAPGDADLQARRARLPQPPPDHPALG